MATMLQGIIKGIKNSVASGSIPREKRIKPYPPIFKSTPAQITDPAVGASTWASGNHV